MNKLIKILATIAIVATMASAQTWNIGYHWSGEGTSAVTATLNEGTLTISGSGDMRDFWGIGGDFWGSPITNVVIEDGVTNIGVAAFSGVTSLTSVTIGNSVITIKQDAFRNTGLTSLSIPNSVTFISDCAFCGTNSLREINIDIIPNNRGFFRDLDSFSITIGNSVTTIRDNAFINATGLTSITIPNSVTTIGNWAFSGATGLTSITIPNSVTTIGDWVFPNTGLTSVTIPSSVTSIGEQAFNGRSLMEINVSADNPNFSSDNGVLFNKDKTILISYPWAKQGGYTIQNNVTRIMPSAFYGAVGLTEIVSLATTPPVMGPGTFFEVSRAIPVYVPAGSLMRYMTAIGWRDFTNIIGIENEVQVIWGRREFEFNLMPQFPDFRLEPANIIDTNHLIMLNKYNVVAGRYRPELQIRDEFRHLYQGVRLVGASVEYEITRRPLNVVMRDQNGNRRDTITAEETIRISGDLFDYIESILGYSNFAIDTINNRTDNESVLRGRPRVGIQSNSRGLRNDGIILDRNINLSIGERFLVTVITDSVTADNYRVLERNIAITIGERFLTLATDPRENITSIANVRRTDNRYGIRFAVNPVSDNAEISVVLPNNERAVETKIVIYDMTGNVVYSGASTASTGSATTATGGAIVWDLRNSAGRIVANGTYLIIAEVKDRNGRVYAYSAKLGVRR